MAHIQVPGICGPIVFTPEPNKSGRTLRSIKLI